jgi:hypothetical protein
MPFVSPTVRLHIKRWSRQALVVGGRALPVPVDIELRGIPAHLWGLETASHLLDEHCLIRDVHPASAEGVDLSVFKLSAWCDEPVLVPTELDLLAEEPRACDSDPSPRTLVFPISVRVFHSDGILDSSPLPPPPPPYSGDDREQDHDKRRKSPHSKPTATIRRPVHARLGPSARAGSARLGSAARDDSARLGPCVRTDSAPGGTVALPVPLGEGSAASESPPLARGSASGWASAMVEFPGASVAEDFVGTGVDASGSPIPSFIPSVSPGPEPVPITPGPASLIVPPHGAVFQTTIMEEFGGCHRTGQNSDCLCIVHSDRASVPNMQDPRVPITNAAQVRDPWEIIKHSLQVKPPCLKVYSRRKDATPVHSQAVSSAALTPLQEFSQHISKAINGLLSPPPVPKRKKKTLPRNFKPRRSRRVAKFPPELGSVAAVSVCKKLGFCDDHGNISLEDASRYAALYNSPLSREHIAALAALFGWDASELA